MLVIFVGFLKTGMKYFKIFIYYFLDIIQLMYDNCRYEKASYIGSRPPFCSVFSEEDLKVLRFLCFKNIIQLNNYS